MGMFKLKGRQLLELKMFPKNCPKIKGRLRTAGWRSRRRPSGARLLLGPVGVQRLELPQLHHRGDGEPAARPPARHLRQLLRGHHLLLAGRLFGLRVGICKLK